MKFGQKPPSALMDVSLTKSDDSFIDGQHSPRQKKLNPSITKKVLVRRCTQSIEKTSAVALTGINNNRITLGDVDGPESEDEEDPEEEVETAPSHKEKMKHVTDEQDDFQIGEKIQDKKQCDSSTEISDTPLDRTFEETPKFKVLQNQYITSRKFTIGISDTKNFLRGREIACQKYNYSLDKRYQNLDHYFATLRLSKNADELIIHNIKPIDYKQMEVCEDIDNQNQSVDMDNLQSGPDLHRCKRGPNAEEKLKPFFEQQNQNEDDDIDEMNKAAVIKNIGRANWDDRLYFRRSKSGASCKISEIESFVYGGFSSRFWLMRKHINSMEPFQLLDLPFYCWECITIQTNKKNINLVIRDQQEMTKLLEFLIVQLKTIDGFRGTGEHYINKCREQQKARERQKEEKNNSKLGIIKKPEQKKRGRKVEVLTKKEWQDRNKFDEEKFAMEQSLYIRVFQRFNLLRVRMKISYMALCKQQTVKEFLLESILCSYNKLNVAGYIRNPWPKPDEQFFQKILAGRTNLKLVIYKRMTQLTNDQLNDDEDYSQLHTEFLKQEILKLAGKNKVTHLFKDFDVKNDEFEKLHKEMNSYVQYKFKKARKNLIQNRLEMISKLSLLTAPQNITCILERIKIQKQLFVLELEQGREVRIPSQLSQKRLPQTFRYYDPIVQITQQFISSDKKEFLNMQLNLVKHFDKKYSLLSLLGLGSKVPKKKKDKEELVVSNQQADSNTNTMIKNNVDYSVSLHTSGIQRSSYIKLNDNLLNFNFDRSKAIRNPSLSEEMQIKLKDELNRVHVKYISQQKVIKQRNFILKSKMMFQQQLRNLKLKGIMLEKIEEMTDQLDDDFEITNKEDYVLKQEQIQARTETLNKATISKLMQVTKKEKVIKEQLKKDYDAIQNHVDKEIEQSIMYFSPEFKEYMKEFEDLIAELEQNEQILANKKQIKLAKAKTMRQVHAMKLNDLHRVKSVEIKGGERNSLQ